MSDLAILWRMARGMPAAADHAGRLEGFYAGQADAYDRFRSRLLHGRDELIARIQVPPGGTWVELGAGTGRNLEALGDRLPALRQAHLVDLCPSLLAVARRRRAGRGWGNVDVVEADATTWRPSAPADVVLCAYSLSMMPDWRAVVANAQAMLKPGGRFAVVDFTLVDAPVAAMARCRPQSAAARWFWRSWFGHDGVRPDAALLPHLARTFRVEHLAIGHGPVPYLPLRMAYATFIGRV